MKNLNVNFILNADSYKNGHGDMLKDDVVSLESNIIARKPSKFTNEVVVMGHQIFIQQYLDIVLTTEDIDEAELEVTEQGGKFNRVRWERIVSEFKGRIPITIRAIPEGTVVPVGTPVVRCMANRQAYVFLSSYVETQLQRAVHYQSTVASDCRSIKKLLADTMERHAGHRFVDYHLHNFGDRSASSYETAILGGIAHGALFSGSDCMSANRYIKHWYHTKTPYLSSVDASEHSVSCSNSDAEKRDDFNMAVKMVRFWEHRVDEWIANGKIGPAPIVSVVIDTYDAYRFAREFIGTRLRETIIEIGKKGGKLVLRPDSGDPTTMPIDILDILMDKFGYTVNSKGYKVLPPFIGVIQGDGIEQDSIEIIIVNLDKKSYSLENIVFGMGGKLVNPVGGRDRYSWAMKGSAQQLDNGTWQDLFKDPITDVGKRSLRGRVTAFECTNSGKIIAERIELQEVNPFLRDMMVDVYVEGVVLNLTTYDDLRTRANKGI